MIINLDVFPIQTTLPCKLRLLEETKAKYLWPSWCSGSIGDCGSPDRSSIPLEGPCFMLKNSVFA